MDIEKKFLKNSENCATNQNGPEQTTGIDRNGQNGPEFKLKLC